MYAVLPDGWRLALCVGFVLEMELRQLSLDKVRMTFGKVYEEDWIELYLLIRLSTRYLTFGNGTRLDSVFRMSVVNARVI